GKGVKKVRVPSSITSISSGAFSAFKYCGDDDGARIEALKIEVLGTCPPRLDGVASSIFCFADNYAAYVKEQEAQERGNSCASPLEYAKIVVHGDAGAYRTQWEPFKDFIIGNDEHEIVVLVGESLEDKKIHGKITLSKYCAKIGETITIKTTPDEEWQLDTRSNEIGAQGQK
ncbi:MAG: hypothetical protein MJ193_04910, partial [Clostridia bacterium]|nr:hypothetical protein [Clostridia bacterium]